MRPATHIPQPTRRPNGRGVVRLNGVDHYLGRAGDWPSRSKSPPANIVAEHQALISVWLANGRSLPASEDDPTVNDVLLAYDRFAEDYYRREAQALLERSGRLGVAHRGVRMKVGRLLASGGMDTTVLLWDVGRLRPAAPPAAAGSAKELAAVTVGTNAVKAHKALWALAGHGDAAVDHLPADLKPISRVDHGRLKKLVAQLADDDTAVRDAPLRDITAMGPGTEPALRAALADSTSAEARRRIRGLLADLAAARTPQQEARLGRALLVLDLAGTAAAVKKLRALADGEPGAELTLRTAAALKRTQLLTSRGRPRPE